jgi:aminopeptidase N
MYPKGAAMLHTLRNVVNDDQKWFQLLKDISTDFKIKNTDTKELVAYISKKLGSDYTYFFDQYLRYASIPVLEYKIKTEGKKSVLEYRWKADVADFRMPIEIETEKGKFEWIKPTSKWQSKTLKISLKELTLKPRSFYVKVDKKS